MSNVIQKRSSVPGKRPVDADLQTGELAVNLTDKRLFSKDGAGVIIDIGVTPEQLALKANAASVYTKAEADAATDARFNVIVGAAPAALDTLNEFAIALGNDANFSGTMTTQLALKASITWVQSYAEPAFAVGTVAQYYRGDKTWQPLTKGVVGLSNADNTSDAAKPISTATATALAGKENSIAAGTLSQYLKGDKTWSDFATDVRAAVLTGLSTASAVAASAADSVLGAIGKLQAQVTNLYSTKENNITVGTAAQYFRGDKVMVTLDKTAVGLSNVDNTSDANKPVSTAQAAALGGKENNVAVGSVSQYYRGDKTWATLDKSVIGLSSVDNTSDVAKPISSATLTALNGKEGTIAAGTGAQYFRGDKVWAALDKTAVGLGSVDNTSDAAKPVSTATASALSGKEPLLAAGVATQYYRGDKTWATLTALAVGLGNVDNTSDANKPVSTAQAAALAGKEPTIAAGTNTQYRRGDKTWQDFATDVRGAVLTGLSIASAVATTAADSVLVAIGKLQAQVNALVTGKENTVAAGTNTQYYRGDKSWVTLDKVAVGLNNVDNTSDASKPVSTATSTALAGKEPTLAAGTASQYYKGNKTWADFTTDLRASVLTGIVVKTLGETIANFGSMIAGTNNIDLSTGGIITLTVANSGSLAFTNVPALVNGASGNAFGFALITINDGTAGRAMAFPASVKWSGGTIPPRTTTAGAKDEWYFYTLDGGVTWTGSLSNQDVK